VFYRGILAMNMRKAIEGKLGLAGLRRAIQSLGVGVAYADGGSAGTTRDVLAKLLPGGEGRLTIGKGARKASRGAKPGAIVSQVQATVALNSELLSNTEFLDGKEGSSAFFALLKSSSEPGDTPLVTVAVGSRAKLMRDIKRSLMAEGVVDPSEFETRVAILAALKQGKILQVIEKAKDQTENQALNQYAAGLGKDAGFATLHLSENSIEGLDAGIHFAFGERIRSNNMMVATGLAIALKFMAGLRGDLLTKAVTEHLPGVTKKSNAFIVENLLVLAQEFVQQALIAKSA